MTLSSTPPLTKPKESIQEAIKHWRDNEAAKPLARWHLVRQQQRGCAVTLRSAVDQVLLNGLEALGKTEPRLAHILRLRFLDNIPVNRVGNQLNLEESFIFELQRDGFEALSKILSQMEAQALLDQRPHWEPRLETPTYSTLIGVESLLTQLYAMLHSQQAPWLVALEGTGGIGKTSLANALTRQLIDDSDFDDFAWITARQTHYLPGGSLTLLRPTALGVDELVEKLVGQFSNNDPALLTLRHDQKRNWLYKRFKQQAHFVVIDNAETLSTANELLPLLQSWCNPSKFLLTTRERFVTDVGLHWLSVKPLLEPDALRLVRHEAQIGNDCLLANASDADLQPIYQTVGGNPLALRLVVGQAYAQGLADVLDDLKQARGAKVEMLYTHLYRRAWDHLDEIARNAWIALPLVDVKSATVEQLLMAVSALPIQPTLHQVRFALEQLVRLNLVDCHGELNQRYYSIHPLTRTFLQEQVVLWQ